MELILVAVIVWVSCWMGYKFGKGENIELIPQKLKAIIRTDAQELEFEKQLKQRK